jgi:voltage-gated potassium channel
VLKASLTSLIRTLNRERVFALILAITIFILLGALAFALTEPYQPPPAATQLSYPGPWYQKFGRAAWWAVVTLTTVGYGDITPVTFGGRVAGIFLMLGGVLTLSLITATVASVFVERKFRRERGLEPIKTTNHILILGWPEDAEVFLAQMLKRLSTAIPVVLVNKVPPEQMEAVVEKYPKRGLFFLWGDYSREETLLKANVRVATKAIILAERQPGETAAQVDQRTLFTALTLRALHTKIRIMAELLRPENRAYLERAGAEEVLIRGEYDSSLLAGAIASPGVYRIYTTLLTGEGQSLWSVEIPNRFHGRAVAELAAYLEDAHQARLIALYTEVRALSLEDLLSQEPTAIDEFIRRKFSETKMTHLLGRTKVEYQVNPLKDQVIVPHQYAVVIAAQRPTL